jgi:hypothetical protein
LTFAGGHGCLAGNFELQHGLIIKGDRQTPGVAGLGLDRAPFEDFAQLAVELHTLFSGAAGRLETCRFGFPFAHEFSLLGLAIISAPRLPVFAAAGVHPYLARGRGRRRRFGPSVLGGAPLSTGQKPGE